MRDRRQCRQFWQISELVCACVTPILGNRRCYDCCVWVYNRTNIPSWSWHSKSIESLFVEQYSESHWNADVRGKESYARVFARLFLVFVLIPPKWIKLRKKIRTKKETERTEKQNDFRTSRKSVQINTCTCSRARACVCARVLFFVLFHYFVSLHSFVAFVQHFVLRQNVSNKKFAKSVRRVSSRANPMCIQNGRILNRSPVLLPLKNVDYFSLAPCFVALFFCSSPSHSLTRFASPLARNIQFYVWHDLIIQDNYNFVHSAQYKCLNS